MKWPLLWRPYLPKIYCGGPAIFKAVQAAEAAVQNAETAEFKANTST